MLTSAPMPANRSPFLPRNGLDLWISRVKFRFTTRGRVGFTPEGHVESDIRFYRRRASEELSAASRAVTDSARERRMLMAGIFLERLRALEPGCASEPLIAVDPAPAFRWANNQSAECA